MSFAVLFSVCALLHGGEATLGSDSDHKVRPKVLGIDLPCTDPAVLTRFYAGLGFSVDYGPSPEGGAILILGEVRLSLSPTRSAIRNAEGPKAAMNLQVQSLSSVEDRVLLSGGKTDRVHRDFVHGSFARCFDPEGNRFDILVLSHEPVSEEPDGHEITDEISVFNLEWTSADLDAAETFCDLLGFEVESRAYLPHTLPLLASGAAQVVVHGGEVAAVEGAASALLLETDDLERSIADLLKVGIEVPRRKIGSNPLGRSVSIRTPGGVPIKIVERALPRLAYERIRRLDGDWRSKSTKGWAGTATFETVARGSSVLQRSEGAHPEETMLSVFHLDGGRLLLTHYCVARNQPRLALNTARSTIDRMEFVFADGTNLATPDHGHMHRAVLTFENDDRYRSHWTWFQDGHESWTEEITNERVDSTAEDRSTDGASAPKGGSCH